MSLPSILSIPHPLLLFAGYPDTGNYWRSWYDSSTFEADVEALFLQLEPLYIQLHAYTRRKLMEIYDKNLFPEEGHIPAHLLGNISHKFNIIVKPCCWRL